MKLIHLINNHYIKYSNYYDTAFFIAAICFIIFVSK